LDKVRPKSVEHKHVALAEVAPGPVESEAARYPARDENPQLERVLDPEWPPDLGVHLETL
jgi:hypothetical protein